MKHYLLLLGSLALLLGCGPDPAEELASLTLTLDLEVNGEPLVLDGTQYVAPSGHTFTVEDFGCYLSNFKLRNPAGAGLFVEPNSYTLVRSQDGAFSVTITGIPRGVYQQADWSVGVDNSANTSLDQRGNLNPSNAMAWNWNTGYKFVLLEGRYFANGVEQGPLVYHIGFNDNYRPLTFTLPQELDLTTHAAATLRFTIDLAALFEGPHLIDFDEYPSLRFEPESGLVADNYAEGFLTLDEVVY